MRINDERQKTGHMLARWDPGHEAGKKEGVAKGREEGVQEGLTKGRDEERLNIARNCKAKGKSIKDIADITGLPEEEISEL